MITTTIELNLIQENIKYRSTDSLGNFIAITSKNRILNSGL
ncbi:hypothetical protein [Chryseobacterium oncorhynchi]|nr:hypothetical protein [Chryseobacterium oncorhynchi]